MSAPLGEAGVFALAIALSFLAARVSKVLVIPLLIFAGTALGPGGLRVLTNAEITEQANGLGLVLMLFFTSLFAHPKALKQGGRMALPLAAYDLVLNFAMAYWIGEFFHWDLEGRLFLAGVMSTSSTGTILKILSDEGRLVGREGNVLVALLWIEDLAFVAYFFYLSAQTGAAGTWTTAETLLAGAALLAFLLGLRMARERIWKLRREVLIPLITGLALLAAYLASLAALPTAVAAFSTGLVLSGKHGAHFIQAEAPYLREGSAALFFFSFGALLDPHVTLDVLPIAAAAIAGIVVTELLFLPQLGRLLGLDWAEAHIVGSSLLARGGKSAAFARLGGDALASQPLVAAQVHSLSGLLTVILTPIAPLFVKVVLWLKRRTGRAASFRSREVVSRLARRVLAPGAFSQRNTGVGWDRVVLYEVFILLFLLGLFACLLPFPVRLGVLAVGLAALPFAYQTARAYFARHPSTPTMRYESRRLRVAGAEDTLPLLLMGPSAMILILPLLAPAAILAFPAAFAVLFLFVIALPHFLHPVAHAPALSRAMRSKPVRPQVA